MTAPGSLPGLAVRTGTPPGLADWWRAFAPPAQGVYGDVEAQFGEAPVFTNGGPTLGQSEVPVGPAGGTQAPAAAAGFSDRAAAANSSGFSDRAPGGILPLPLRAPTMQQQPPNGEGAPDPWWAASHSGATRTPAFHNGQPTTGAQAPGTASGPSAEATRQPMP